jgi:hypothetical protein
MYLMLFLKNAMPSLQSISASRRLTRPTFPFLCKCIVAAAVAIARVLIVTFSSGTNTIVYRPEALFALENLRCNSFVKLLWKWMNIIAGLML